MFGNGLRPQIWSRFVQRFNIPNLSEFYGSTEGNSQISKITEYYSRIVLIFSYYQSITKTKKALVDLYPFFSQIFYLLALSKLTKRLERKSEMRMDSAFVANQVGWGIIHFPKNVL